MNKFKFQSGTKVFCGSNCLFENKNEIIKLGKKAFIVTGKASGHKSGALSDIINILNEAEIKFEIFDKIENNPSLHNVKDGGTSCRMSGADFIIGIGGGSPLDAAKAIAILAVNDIEPIQLLKNEFTIKPLPIAAIPTTAGTGSEVTAASILTIPEYETKMSFVHEDVFPKVAFLDAKYTESMKRDIAVNTAIDAMSHAIEGYLNRTASPMSDIFALESLNIFGTCLENLCEERFDYDTREKLLYASMLAGLTIAQTGTTIAHGMGYSLTYFKDIPHGKANGLLLPEYLRYNYQVAQDRVESVLKALKLISIDEFEKTMRRLISNDINFSQEELKKYSSLAMKQKSTLKNLRTVTEEDMYKILDKSLRS
ncbi:iron-containing alcohol dehydrogenase family protein [Pseudobacteroides cellulosolvens]|uniref:Alcohol dehydrogenase n=1 Tax=Pseudobacteroides cellulosolvens ATCC 35603 = DSM 2933 TaxID=398512 RepID=A0A0L6JNZ1_9FIRM|nr:iron-containing alcohol dehydrogenase family protein [Pseudobacteroides cellulosolvens]KNY27420.1 Alcohol dehydrogenase [Pseudobacteroides cellulosolvens ATCC 35603 = DSM 2933]